VKKNIFLLLISFLLINLKTSTQENINLSTNLKEFENRQRIFESPGRKATQNCGTRTVKYVRHANGQNLVSACQSPSHYK